MKNQLIFLLIIMGLVFSLPACREEGKNASSETSNSASETAIEKINRFLPEIQKFEKEDKANGLTQNGILFTGSSSIRMWSTLAEDMAPMPVLNRGFGGSTIPEVLHFSGKYLFQHNPQIIVFYCGENDIAEGQSPETVYDSFKTFVKIIETKLPNTKLVFISMKPSTARWDLWMKYKLGNGLIQTFMSKKPNMLYVDSSETMLDSNGKVKEDIFIEDGLHMNAKGYTGWTQQLKPILEGIYQTK